MRSLIFLLAFVSSAHAAEAPPAGGAGAKRLALMPLMAGEGASRALADTITERIGSELRKRKTISVITPQEIAATLSHTQQAQLLSCDSDACTADFGGAIGVPEIITGVLAKVGSSWLITLKRIDVVKVKTLTQVDRRLRGGTIDDVLDALPGMTAELFGETSNPVAASRAQLPQRFLRKKAAHPPSAETHTVLESKDPAIVVVVDPKRKIRPAFFAGSRSELWAQTVFGSSRNGDNFDFVYWEPRVMPDRYKASVGRKDGDYFLRCGDNKIALTPVIGTDAEQLLATASVYERPWSRRAWILGRNDLGDYFYVDRPRDDDESDNRHFWMGPAGDMRFIHVKSVLADNMGEVLITDRGRLKWDAKGKTLEWIADGGRTPLVLLERYNNAKRIYSKLGVYPQELGSACDGLLK